MRLPARAQLDRQASTTLSSSSSRLFCSTRLRSSIHSCSFFMSVGLRGVAGLSWALPDAGLESALGATIVWITGNVAAAVVELS